MSDPERPPSSVGIDNKAPNQGAQCVFNAPVYFGIGSLADRDRIDRDKRNRERMLERVQTFWIKGVLEQSLHGAALIALSLDEQSDFIENPWRLILQEADQPAQSLPSGTHIAQVYDEVGGNLLILGEPGAGKTTLLLELTRDLLDRARHDESHPIPIVFNLSSWAEKRQPLAIWLVEELLTKYGVPRATGQAWVDAGQILPLLDGLDEVPPTACSACIDAINAYRRAYGMIPMVVCSRSDEYLAQTARLSLDRAVMVQPLTMQQIDEYLQSAGPQLEALRKALHEDPGLQELATTPLMLSVLTLAYHGEPVENLQSGNSSMVRQQVFATYVDRMLKRRGVETHYTPQQTIDWLAWLAQQLAHQNRSEFYLEQMQPDWLLQGWLRRLYPGTVRLITALMSGLVVGSVFGLVLLPLMLFGSPFGVTTFFTSSSLPASIGPLIASGLVVGFLVGLMRQIPRDIHPTEVIVWSWANIWRSLVKAGSLRSGLVGGLLSVLLGEFLVVRLFSAGLNVKLFAVLVFGFIGATISGFTGAVVSRTLDSYTHVRPGTRIQRSRWVSTLVRVVFRVNIGLLSAVMSMPISLLLTGILVLLTNVTIGIFVGVPLVLFSGLISGFSVALTIWEPGGIPLGRAVGWTWTHAWHSLIRMRWIKGMFAFGLATLLISRATLGITNSLILGLFLGVMFGSFTGLVDELIGGLSSRELERHTHIRPNQGIRRSGRNSILIGLAFGLVGGLLFGLVGGLLGFIINLESNSVLIFENIRSYGLFFGVLGGIISGLTAGLLNGGVAYLQHGMLRLLLWTIDATPRHYVRFLDYAHERILLRKIGGGYTFAHRQLLDYFATYVQGRQSTSPKKGIRLQLPLIGLATTVIASVTGFVGYNVVQYERDPALRYAHLYTNAATIAANPYPSYLPGSGILVVYDSLSQPNIWSESNPSANGTCHFFHGAFHIYSSEPNTFYPCNTTLPFNNMAFALQMTIIKGDCGGMLLRYNSSTNQGYYLAVCQNRSYQFVKYVDFTGKTAHTLVSGSSSAIHGGWGQSNLIAVVARGSMFDLYW